MKMGDKLKIDWGGSIYNVKLANGLDNIVQDESKIKVIFEGDNSYNPITINRSCVIEVNGESV